MKKSDKPTKINEAMKKTMKYLRMAALALVGAVVTGCSSDDNLADEQPAKQDNIVTVTTTVGLDDVDGGETRALAIDYDARTVTKTFAVGDQVALVYKNTSDEYVLAESNALTAEDISADGKSATLTFTLTNPQDDQTVEYYYPAALVSLNEDGNIVVPISTQDGTLAGLQRHDYTCCNTGYLSGTTLSSVTLENKFTIVAFTLKDATGENNITTTITRMTIKAGAENYTVTGHDADGHIYVIMRPVTDEQTIAITATDGTNNYIKKLTDKTWDANNFYQQGLRMIPGANLSVLTAAYTAKDGETLTGTLGKNVQISIADGATVTLDDATINDGENSSSYKWAGITCLGDATIILSGTNTVKGFHENYPGIHVPSGKTLTIQGSGSLTASSNGHGAGIGGGRSIACGNIHIKGGTVTATGGYAAAGIGGGSDATCGYITITSGVTSVTATKGETAPYSIGAGGNEGTCGTVTIGGVTGAITESPYTYRP